MADSGSARLGLPFIETGQAQKELAHNEALALLDIAVQAGIEAVGLDQPPASPTTGACWIVGTAPSGVWAGQAGALAGWTASGWRFVTPRDGLAAWDCAARQWLVRVDGAWESGTIRGERLLLAGQRVVGPRGAAIPNPSGGTTVDSEARAAVESVLTALRTHGLIAT